MSKSGKRGQTVSIDLIAGISISLLILAYYLVVWNSMAGAYEDAFRKEDSEIALLTMGDMLVNSPGNPENWTMNASGAQAIGLASRPGVLDFYKVVAFSEMPYAYVKHKFGISSEFLVKIESPDGIRYATVGNESEPSNVSSQMSRLATMDGKPVVVRVQIYEK